jgi:hypothetical protein
MAGFKITIEGADAINGKLDDLHDRIRDAATDALHRSVGMVRDRAVEGIANGPKTGRIYTQLFARSWNGGLFAYGSRKPHQASAIGEYPAADTGNLMRSIYTDVGESEVQLDNVDEQVRAQFPRSFPDASREKITGEVGADAEYAAPLEYKPETNGGRPFLRRALMESRDAIKGVFQTYVRAAVSPAASALRLLPPPPPPPIITPPPPRPRPPSGGASESNEGKPGFSAEELNRAELERTRPPALPPPDDEGGG